jgi:hypothetical protein
MLNSPLSPLSSNLYDLHMKALHLVGAGLHSHSHLLKHLTLKEIIGLNDGGCLAKAGLAGPEPMWRLLF